jgi:hypothetical protein
VKQNTGEEMPVPLHNQLYAITLLYSDNGEECNQSTYLFLSDSPLFTQDALNEAFNQLRSNVVLDDGTLLESYNISKVKNNIDTKVFDGQNILTVTLFRQ